MRAWLDRVYDYAGYAAALFLVGIVAMVLAGIAGRAFGFYLRGTDVYAGYCMAACGFLALAYTLHQNEHIRVTLILHHVPRAVARVLELSCHVIGVLVAAALAWFSMRLAWQSYAFNDISTGVDATPLWIPQLSMAAGAMILFVALVDHLVMETWRRETEVRVAETPAHVE